MIETNYELRIVYTTLPDAEKAKELATAVLKKSLAVCVNIMPNGISCYIWNDDIICENECYVLFKTTTQKLQQLVQYLEDNHPYDTPALLVLAPQTSKKFFMYTRDC